MVRRISRAALLRDLQLGGPCKARRETSLRARVGARLMHVQKRTDTSLQRW
jgi:hypothetical protein